MAPIRVGIIGLSATDAAIAPGSWASAALLPSFKNSPGYEIVALCNSSQEAARHAIKWHKLPASTKAYGNAEQLAQDSDVDLVVVSVGVGKHYQLTLPALANDKQVFVEWPLGASLREAEELTALAEAKGLKTIIGLQSRGDLLIQKLKEIIKSGEIGEVRSTSLTGALPGFFSGFWIEGAEYYLDFKSGGNIFHIAFGHILDSFNDVLGDFDLSSLSAILKNDVTELPIRSLDLSRVVNASYRKTAPDQIMVQGKLQSGAVASLIYRTTPATPNDVGVRWIITGSKGEIEVTTDRGQYQMDNPSRKLKIKLADEKEAREVDFRSGAELGGAAGVPDVATNTALILEAFSKGDTSRYADFSSALKHHRLLEEITKVSGYEY